MMMDWTVTALNMVGSVKEFGAQGCKPFSTTEGAEFLDKLRECQLLIITYSL
jgi:hypothetical protein